VARNGFLHRVQAKVGSQRVGKLFFWEARRAVKIGDRFHSYGWSRLVENRRAKYAKNFAAAFIIFSELVSSE
jgi:hypothetical protein